MRLFECNMRTTAQGVHYLAVDETLILSGTRTVTCPVCGSVYPLRRGTLG